MTLTCSPLRRRRRIIRALLLLGVAACASSKQPLLNAPPKLRDQSEMTQDEIRATQYTNMYDVIQALRGNWLRRKGDMSLIGEQTQIQVYLDTQRIGGPDELKTIVPINVALVRYFDPQQASARWGVNHGQGAIYLLSARR
jgi:hypothetical protein